MKTSTKMVLGTLAIGLGAFLFLSPHAPPGNQLWSPGEGISEPTGAQMAFLMAYALFAALAMGFGLSFLVWGRAWTRRTFPAWSLPAHLAITWVIASFWVHDNLHVVNGENLNGLIAIEYGFHVPYMLAGVVLIIASAKSARELRSARSPRTAAAPS